ncbi:glycerol dehydrogenase [Anaerosalibacter massiliensis]|uniref:Glycerol dehydrogenase n=1 Tax=Anaerosalibacter massiliensis TaxID=1347392 RepID=A0A9X2MFQ3_9FIRM|nr:glycerol dehydrogenase [Anaerosalibacter massiliensis]MCR2044182.1 glycerol dehydrogenase [Anaerosalibacter massiliensis]
MEKLMRAPSRYVQDKDVILKMKDHTTMLGDSFYIIASKTAMKVTRPKIEKSFEETDVKLVFETFNGESSKGEINRIRDLVKENGSNVIVGVGGGKTIDTAKAVAYFEKLPIVIIPTVTATDAPCTALSVIYTDEGEFSEYLFYPTNPDVVMVDTAVVANAPARFLVDGMGDALGTYFEARACLRSNSPSLAFGGITQAGFALTKLCYETLLEYGYEALLAVEKKVVTPAVEKIVEAATYLSGVGAENGGLAAAHSIYNGFTVLEECEYTSHGRLVAFGTLVQLVLEGSPTEEIEEVIDFCLSVGLPITLEEVGTKEIDGKKLMKASKVACAEGESIHHILGGVTPEQLFDAIIATDNLGKHYKDLI